MLRGPLLALWDEQTSRREGRGRKKEEGVYILEYEKKGNEWCVWRRSWKKKVAGVTRHRPQSLMFIKNKKRRQNHGSLHYNTFVAVKSHYQLILFSATVHLS